MGVLRSVLRVLLGFLLACVVAGLVQVLYVNTPAVFAATPAGEVPGLAGYSLVLTLLAATHSAIFSVAFALIIAGIAEWLSLKTLAYSLAAGMGIALLGFFAQYTSEVAGQPSIFNNYALQAYLTAGFFAGLTYWLIAGRHAGLRYEPAPAGLAKAISQQVPRARVVVEKATGEVKEVKKGSLAERLAEKRAALAAGVAAGIGAAKTAVPVTKAAPPNDAQAKKPSEPAKPSVPEAGKVQAASQNARRPDPGTGQSPQGGATKSDETKVAAPSPQPAKAEPSGPSGQKA